MDDIITETPHTIIVIHGGVNKSASTADAALINLFRGGFKYEFETQEPVTQSDWPSVNSAYNDYENALLIDRGMILN